MNNYKYSASAWTFYKSSHDDARYYLEAIVYNASIGIIQPINYQESTVFVISEQQFKKVEKYLYVNIAK